MGNTWSFTILLGSESPLADSSLEIVLHALGIEGFTPCRPIDNTLKVMKFGGYPDLSFSSLSHAREHLLGAGGSLTLWSRDGADDIGLFISLIESEISFSVTYDLTEERFPLVKQLLSAFTAACASLNACYGYASDEWKTESLLEGSPFEEEWQRFRQSVKSQDPPYILFWLNWFSSKYYASIPKQCFEPVSPETTAIENKGVLLKLGQYPWQEPPHSHMARLVNGEYRHRMAV